jgi:hypothetical protein
MPAHLVQGAMVAKGNLPRSLARRGVMISLAARRELSVDDDPGAPWASTAEVQLRMNITGVHILRESLLYNLSSDPGFPLGNSSGFVRARPLPSAPLPGRCPLHSRPSCRTCFRTEAGD